MKPLTQKQKRLVNARLSGMNITQASKEAGYCDHGAGSRAMALPQVQQEVSRRVQQVLLNSSLDAAKTLGDLLTTADSEKVRLDAAQSVLNRTGHVSTDEPNSATTLAIQINLG
jgi:phage terminase small subunit